MTRDEILQKKTLGTITNQKKVCQMAHFPFECPDYKAIKRNLFIFSISQDSLDLLYKELNFLGVRRRFESHLDLEFSCIFHQSQR